MLFIVRNYFTNHLTHFLLNNAFPLLDISRKLTPPGWKKDVLFLGGLSTPFPTDWWGIEQIYADEELVLNHTVCYPYGVLGTTNICSFPFCENQHEPLFFDQVRNLTLEYCRERSSQEGLKNQDAPLISVIQRNGTRAIHNLRMVLELLDTLNLDYRVTHFEKPTFCDQVLFFHETKLILTPHGNALGNMVWMQKHSAVIELTGYEWKSPYFAYLNYAMGRPHWYGQVRCPGSLVKCTLPHQREGFPPKDRTVIVDINSLKMNLQKALEYLKNHERL